MKHVKVISFLVLALLFLTNACSSGASGETTSYTVKGQVTDAGQSGDINGSISCTSPVNYGSISTCTITPNSGYAIGYVNSTCGGSLVGNTFTTGAVTSNCIVSTTFIRGATERKPNPPTNLKVL